MMQRLKTPVLAVAAILFPGVCFAQALTSTAGLFYALSGVILTVGILTFFAGLGAWFNRLDTSPSHREETIVTMEYGVTVLFALIVLLIVVQFIQTYTAYAYLVIAIVIIFYIAKLVLFTMSAGKEEEKKKEGAH